MNPSVALASIPDGLRTPLLEEYREITKNYAEHRWSPTELSGGRFCEIIYTILQGYSTGQYPAGPAKPNDFVTACRALESQKGVPRSFQILIPRMLPALYEIRNNRGVGHVGGDVDPNHMDATAVLSMCNWIMAELVRVYHALDTKSAQVIVDNLAERKIPLVWQSGDLKRVLKPDLPLADQVLLLLASSPSAVELETLFEWSGYGNKTYFKKLLMQLHEKRLLDVAKDGRAVQILPPGTAKAAQLIVTHLNK